MLTTSQLTADGALEFLSFRLGAEEYGVDIQKVQELRGYTPVTTIANAPACLKGVVNLRGLIVRIIDLRIKFDLPNPSYDVFTVVIILSVGESKIGVVVDSVSDVITLTPAQIKPVPALAAGVDGSYVVGMGALDERMIILVDMARLISSNEAAPLERLAA